MKNWYYSSIHVASQVLSAIAFFNLKTIEYDRLPSLKVLSAIAFSSLKSIECDRSFYYKMRSHFTQNPSSIENLNSFTTNEIGLSINEYSFIENLNSFTTNEIGLSINEYSSIENLNSFTTNEIGLSINEYSFIHNQILFTTNELIFCAKRLHELMRNCGATSRATFRGDR
ncbi:hypothetical protein [Nostoc sp. T09]|uniref:hypothetical protein n=1 Tax=Nostoc sp. T09 TaxID=1932621 RepID=UPI00117EE5F0|nr:hypothetical protein [Nostoc sp. T09]